MDGLQEGDEVYVPTRWLQVVSYLMFVNQDANLRLCLLYGYKLYTTPLKLLKIIKDIATEKLELSVVDPTKVKAKVNSFVWLWLVHFLTEDFKSGRVRTQLWGLIDLTMTREEQNRVKLLCLQGFGCPAQKPSVLAHMARVEATDSLPLSSSSSSSNGQHTPTKGAPEASPSVSRTPSTTSSISFSDPVALTRSSSSSSSSASSSPTSSRRSSSAGSTLTITPPSAHSPSPVPSIKENGHATHLSLLHFPNLKDLAKQLTLYEFRIFKQVAPSEFYGSTTKGTKFKAPNLTLLVEISNKISAWLAFEILSAPVSQRVRALEAAIKLTCVCRDMHNYNTAMELHSSLCQSSIIRLRKTWADISSEVREMHEEMDALLNPISNFKAYRTELKAKAADTLVRFATPVLPYVGTFLRDVVFACDGNPDFIDLGDGVKVMNFDRLHMVGAQIVYFNKFKKREYPYHAVSDIQEKLRGLPLYEEDVISQLSYQCEPLRTPAVAMAE